jgi:hypothetical protein
MNIEVLTIQDIELIKRLIMKELLETFQMTKKGKTWLKSEDAMEYLKCSKSTLKHLRLTDQIPYTKIGGRCLYSVEDIEALLHKNSKDNEHNTGPTKDDDKTCLSSS